MKKKLFAILTAAIMTFGAVIGLTACDKTPDDGTTLDGGSNPMVETLLDKVATLDVDSFTLDSTVSGTMKGKEYNDDTNTLDPVEEKINLSLNGYGAEEKIDLYLSGKAADDSILGMFFARGSDLYVTTSEDSWTELGLKEGDFAGYLAKFKQKDSDFSFDKISYADGMPVGNAVWVQFLSPEIMSYAFRLYLNLCTFGGTELTEKEGEAYYLTCNPEKAMQALIKQVSELVNLVNSNSTLTSLVTSQPFVTILDKLFAGISAKDLYDFVMNLTAKGSTLAVLPAPKDASVSKYIQDLLASEALYNAVVAQAGPSPFPNAKCFGDITVKEILAVSGVEETQFNSMLSMIKGVLETLSKGDLYTNILQMIPAENDIKSLDEDTEYVFAFDYTTKELMKISVNGEYKIVVTEKEYTQGGVLDVDVTVEYKESVEITFGQSGQFADLTGVNYHDVTPVIPPIDPVPGEMVGTYKFYSISEDGINYGIGDTFEGQILSEDSMTFELKADGTAVAMSGWGLTLKGTWRLNEKNQTRIDITFADETKTATLEGDTLVIRDGDEILTLKRDSGAPVDPDPTPDPVDPEKIVGTYKFYSVNIDGMKVQVGGKVGDIVLSEDLVTIKLNADGTAVLTSKMGAEMPEEVKGTWRLNETKTKIEITIEGDTETATLEGDMLVIRDGDEILTLKRDFGAPVDPDPTPDPVDPEKIVGTYKFYSMSIDGMKVEVGGKVGDIVLSEDLVTIKLNADGSAVGTLKMGAEMPEEVKGAWRLNATKTKIEITFDGETETATLEGDLLVIIDADEILTLKRDSAAPVDPDPTPDPAPVLDPEKIVGTYKFYSMSSDGMTVGVGDTVEELVLSEDFITIKLNADGTAVGTLKMGVEMTQNGTWKINGEDKTKVDITLDGDTATATLEGDMLVIIMDADEILTLKRDPNTPVDPDPTPDPNLEKIVGTYKFYSMNAYGINYGIGDKLEGQTLSEEFVTLKLNADGTGVATVIMNGDKTTVTFTWTSENKVSATGETTISIEAKLDDGSIINATLDGDLIEVYLERVITAKLKKSI